MSRITKQPDGPLIVPDNPTIPYITGDGVGKEITPSMLEVVSVAVRVAYGTHRQIVWKEALAGENAFHQTGKWLPDETIEKFEKYKVGIKGPLHFPNEGDIPSLDATLRLTFDLYAGFRTSRWFLGIFTPIVAPEKVHLTLFYENVEDICTGIQWQKGTAQAEKFMHLLTDEMGVKSLRFPESSSFGIKVVSKEGVERLVRAACHYAVQHDLPSVTLIHKSDMMNCTEGSFKYWGYELAQREFAEELASGKLVVKDCTADSFMQDVLLKPEEFSVVVALNITGSYTSDLLAAMSGGIGVAPSANINFETGNAVFECLHGTIPYLAGKNAVNPSALILSAVMMLEYMGWHEASVLISRALEKSFEDGRATFDLARFMPSGHILSTTDFTREIIERIEGRYKER